MDTAVPETVIERADLSDLALYKNVRRVADIIFECIKSVTDPSNHIGMDDRRVDWPNAFYHQTASGLFLGFYYDLPSRLWTPWGKWGFGGSGGGGDWRPVHEMILTRLGATVHREETDSVDPVYALHKVDDVDLPEPRLLDRNAYASYEDSRRAWEALTLRHNEESRS